MAKALFGTNMTGSAVQLVDEVRALRGRVAQLEAELAAAEQARTELERRAARAADADLLEVEFETAGA